MFYIKHPPFLIVLLKYTSVKEFEFLMDMLTYIEEERRIPHTSRNKPNAIEY